MQLTYLRKSVTPPTSGSSYVKLRFITPAGVFKNSSVDCDTGKVGFMEATIWRDGSFFFGSHNIQVFGFPA